ncbi:MULTISPECIES: hypothetical protein [Gordonia]|uniref:Uncharacterized protein n=1 Tax=Gordonia amicalis TaxID=89053 RepID=A0ABU4D8I5_9ACTN|nr:MULTISPECIES: hypothetical protein [Gordonia]ATD70735.1 hypothetical protein CNO18_11135 [Gordonia sp. 1D]MDV6306038.1 hypothetical protein [Gordonia amicalis]
MWGDDVEAAIKAVEDREQGCPDDPQLAAIWRDERDGRAYCPGDPILAAALDATRSLPDSGPIEPEPTRPVERPEARGGGDPWKEGQALQAAHERSSWVNSGAYRFADTRRVRDLGGEP